MHPKKVDITARRRIYAYILLVIFLSIQSLTILHTHHDVVEDSLCRDCVTHVHHYGHLSTLSLSIDNCLICQFQSVTFTVAEMMLFIAYLHTEPSSFACTPVHLYLTEVQYFSLRAPPAFG